MIELNQRQKHIIYKALFSSQKQLEDLLNYSDINNLKPKYIKELQYQISNTKILKNHMKTTDGNTFTVVQMKIAKSAIDDYRNHFAYRALRADIGRKSPKDKIFDDLRYSLDNLKQYIVDNEVCERDNDYAQQYLFDMAREDYFNGK